MKRNRKNQIVIVDDDPEFTSLLETVFEDIAFNGTLKIIHSGIDLLGWLDINERPNCILLDINMPNCNGFDLLKMIKRIDQFKAIPVVMLSASEHKEDIRQSYSYGANAYMVKPMVYNSLRQDIHTISQYWIEVSRTPEGHWSEDREF